MENLDILVKRLQSMPTETEWLEFKHNNYDPDTIGRDISALANSAAFVERDCAYMIWGIDDETHEIIGSETDQYLLKKGNQEIDSWLKTLLSTNAEFEFHFTEIENKKIVILIIYKAVNQTVTFKKVEYIRVGSYTKKLEDHPSMKAQLWDKLRATHFEDQVLKKDLHIKDALHLLEYSTYFETAQIPQPSDNDGVMHYMLEDGIIVQQDNGLYGITCLGAMLFAKRLTDFQRIARKAVRVVQYKNNSRLTMLKEDTSNKGYAVGFEGLIKYIDALLPSQEVIDGALREKHFAYPMVAIREAVANALIHQDGSITGTGPLVEIFETRIEITNSGTPLIDVARIVDNPPKSRNEKLASLMRRLRMCEELGTGWDRIVSSCESAQLPAPKIDLYDGSTKVTLFSKVPFSNISQDDKMWACYLHACVKYVEGEHLTNGSLRNRFGLQKSSSGTISRLIKEAVDKKLIKPLDSTTAPRYMRYVPYFA